VKIVTCDDNGGQGIGAGHVCKCVRTAGHPNDSDRPHGCVCGALWGNRVQITQPETRLQTISVELTRRMSTRVHEHTDEQWAKVLEERTRRYNEWRELTNTLLAEGVIERSHEDDGDYELDSWRPYDRVYETDEQYARRHGLTIGQLHSIPRHTQGTVTFPVLRETEKLQ